MGDDVKLKLDGDTAAYLGKMKQAHEVTAGLGEKFKEIGEHIEHRFTHGLERSLFKVLAIKEAVTGIAEGFQKASERAAELSKKTGQNAVSSASALSELGFHGEALENQMGALERSDGASTTAQRIAFAGKLAAENRKRREKFLQPINQTQAARAMALYGRGGDYAFGQGGEDLAKPFGDRLHGLNPDINAIAGGVLKQKFGTSDLNAVLDEAPDAVRGEFEIGNVERQNEVEAAEATRTKGHNARIAQAKLASRRTLHPVASGVLDALNPLTFGAANAALGQLAEGEAGGPGGGLRAPAGMQFDGRTMQYRPIEAKGWEAKMHRAIDRLSDKKMRQRSGQDEH